MAEDFELDTRQLGALPIINAFADRLGMDGLLERFLPTTTGGSSSRPPPRSGWS